MRIAVELSVDSNHEVDLKGIAELIGNSLKSREEMSAYNPDEWTIEKTPDGYWRTIFREVKSK